MNNQVKQLLETNKSFQYVYNQLKEKYPEDLKYLEMENCEITVRTLSEVLSLYGVNSSRIETEYEDINSKGIFEGQKDDQFSYFARFSQWHDGTLLFSYDALGETLNKILNFMEIYIVKEILSVENYEEDYQVIEPLKAFTSNSRAVQFKEEYINNKYKELLKEADETKDEKVRTIGVELRNSIFGEEFNYITYARENYYEGSHNEYYEISYEIEEMELEE